MAVDAEILGDGGSQTEVVLPTKAELIEALAPVGEKAGGLVSAGIVRGAAEVAVAAALVDPSVTTPAQAEAVVVDQVRTVVAEHGQQMAEVASRVKGPGFWAVVGGISTLVLTGALLAGAALLGGESDSNDSSES